MEMIAGINGIGKTKALITKATAENGVIVCANTEKMLEKIHAYGHVGIEVVTYEEFISNKLWEDGRKYFVRRVEELLGAMNVETFTITTQK